MIVLADALYSAIGAEDVDPKEGGERAYKAFWAIVERLNKAIGGQ